MLVLSRKENETIEIPGVGIVIRLFGLSRRRVQVGIEAPDSLRIVRGESVRFLRECSPLSSKAVIEGEFAHLESELMTLADQSSRDRHELVNDALARIRRIRHMACGDQDREQESQYVGESTADYQVVAA